MRAIFMGSPDFAVPSLIVMARITQLAMVITQPDRPAGRGRRLTMSPVKRKALSLGLQVFQPFSLMGEDVTSALRGMNPDVIVVVAYGEILPASLLSLPPDGSVNVHASLLPRWRGAAPVQSAIAHGDSQTGVSLMKMDEGLDTGPIIAQASTPIGAQETGGELTERLAVLGAQLLEEKLPSYLSGELQLRGQNDTKATYAPMLKRGDGFLDLASSAEVLARRVRAFNPWPGTHLMWGDQRLAIHEASAADYVIDGTIGRVIMREGTPAVITGDGALLLDVIQPPGKRKMRAVDFTHGAPTFIGSVLTGSHSNDAGAHNSSQ
jgi:methionyl-tRNA formyltransferase